MRKFSLTLLIVSIMATSCPNDCSGHGLCQANGKCVCYRQDGLAINNANFEEFGYTNNDCSQRLCPKGPSHQYTSSDPIMNDISANIYTMSIVDFSDEQNVYYTNLKLLMPNYYFSYGKSVIYTEDDVTELDETHSGSIQCYYDPKLKNQYKTYQIYQTFKDTSSTIITYLIGNEVELPIIKESNEDKNGYNSLRLIPDHMYCRVIEEYTDFSLFTTFPITVPLNSDINEIEFEIPGNEFDPPINNFLNPIYYELTDKQQMYIDTSVESNITFLCFDRFNKYHLHELRVKLSNIYYDYKTYLKRSIVIETVKSDILSSCFMLYSTVRHTSYRSNNDYEIFKLIGETGELGVLLPDSVMIPIEYKDSYNSVDINEYTLVVDISSVLSQIIKSNNNNNNNNGYKSTRYTNITEITNIMNEGSTAKLWYFPVNNITQILPIQSQILHIREITEIKNNLVKIRFYERVINYIRENEIIDYIDNIKLTGLNTDDYLITLQVFNSGPFSFIECSGVGECNRENGQCKCQSGYEGIACERTACPNNCNGKGICEIVNSDEDGYGYIHTQTRCKCDGGYRGSDCSMKECPSSEDPNKATNVISNENGEFRDCSGRGICDYTTGTCKCFNGFGGEGCGEVHSQF